MLHLMYQQYSKGKIILKQHQDQMIKFSQKSEIKLENKSKTKKTKLNMKLYIVKNKSKQ